MNIESPIKIKNSYIITNNPTKKKKKTGVYGGFLKYGVPPNHHPNFLISNDGGFPPYKNHPAVLGYPHDELETTQLAVTLRYPVIPPILGYFGKPTQIWQPTAGEKDDNHDCSNKPNFSPLRPGPNSE